MPPASLLNAERLNVFTTDLIAAGVWVLRMVGAGKEKRDWLDGSAQDIFTQVHYHKGVSPELFWFEGAKHSVYGEDVEYMVHEGGATLLFAGATTQESELVDVIENTNAILLNKPDKGGSGGSSLILSGPLVKVFGGGKDELGAAIIIGWVPPDKMHLFLPSQGGKPLDPDKPVVENIQRLLDAGGQPWSNLQDFLMDRKRTEKKYLQPLSAQMAKHPGMELPLVGDGSYDGGLLSILGRQSGKYPVMTGTAGSTEAVANYLQALLVDGVVVGLRFYSPLSKIIGDIVGSLNKTLADLSPEQVAMVKEKAKLTDAQGFSRCRP